MHKKLLFLRCWLCRGFSSRCARNLQHYLANHNHYQDLEQLANICKIKPQFRQTFIHDFINVDQQQYQQCQQHHYVTFTSSSYPRQLYEAYSAPPLLFYEGDLQLLTMPMVAIVGARRADNYTYRVLHHLIPQLVKHNICIVSGLAQGADSYAHQLALQYGGKTIGVLGNGLDICYPTKNTQLQQTIKHKGLLLSEYVHGTPARHYHFPQRNRIIAGLCHTLLVTQAQQRSGSLITANLALDDNRNVLAVPGNIDCALSAGCNELIMAGATPYLHPQQILATLQYI
ncbi:MAG: DNA-processing protein DprA [Candidatus Paralactobacillus gallistercoris]|uniref:DNA-processing protein DprA n=1 Tax=Candidatus Paralactobacillus gallistercoris TaxID=2838724 RepID=A0A948TK05_9LACO|nr:DNA-processing protein DprA [Candidatus Paralactobacillus gallistercoris]